MVKYQRIFTENCLTPKKTVVIITLMVITSHLYIEVLVHTNTIYGVKIHTSEERTMVKIDNNEINMEEFMKRYAQVHPDGSGLSADGVALAYRYLDALNISFGDEDSFDLFMSGKEESVLSVDDKFREMEQDAYFEYVTGMAEAEAFLLSHLFWEALEKEPDTGSIIFDDADLSEEEYMKNQEAVEKYHEAHRFRYEKLEETVGDRFEKLSEKEMLELAQRMEKRYRLPKDGDIQSVILNNGNVLHIYGCNSDPKNVNANELLG